MGLFDETEEDVFGGTGVDGVVGERERVGDGSGTAADGESGGGVEYDDVSAGT